MRNSACQMKLTPLKIVYCVPIPNIPNHQWTAIKELEDNKLITNARATQWAHEYLQPKLGTPYNSGPVPQPQNFQPKDWIYV